MLQNNQNYLNLHNLPQLNGQQVQSQKQLQLKLKLNFTFFHGNNPSNIVNNETNYEPINNVIIDLTQKY